MSFHQYTSLVDTEKQRTKRLLAILSRGTISIWQVDKHEAKHKKDIEIHRLVSAIVPGAISVIFLPYGGSPVLAVAVNSSENNKSQVQLWELLGFDSGTISLSLPDSKTSPPAKMELKQVPESKAGLHSANLQCIACCQNIVFSSDKMDLKTWVMAGWEKDQWLVKTHSGRPDILRLTRGTLHHGISHRVINMYVSYFPLGKSSAQRAGRKCVGASVLFTCSRSDIRVWQVVRGGAKMQNVDLKRMYTLTYPGEARKDGKTASFTGHMICTNPYRGSQWAMDSVSACDPYNEISTAPQLAHKERPHLVFAGLSGPTFDGVGVWRLGEEDAYYIGTLVVSGVVSAMAFGPYANGPLVAASEDGAIEMWTSPFTGPAAAPITIRGAGHGSAIRAFAIEPNLTLWALPEASSKPVEVSIVR